jgi:type I site-specific restriction-modification system R (restriction) subunit
VDFANPENNDFVVANQLTVIENGVNKRPDVVVFVNGLPLVVIELKNNRHYTRFRIFGFRLLKHNKMANQIQQGGFI